jgi:hypothetical protein
MAAVGEVQARARVRREREEAASSDGGQRAK